MSSDKFLTYRGDIKATVGIGGTLAFVTVHAEGQPTALFRLNADKLTLAEDALPAGGTALVADGDVLWIAGSDGQLYQCAVQSGTPKPRGLKLGAAPTRLALLADDRLAVLAGAEITILSRKDGKALQTLALPEPGSALAADPTGRWLVAGTVKGTALVFDCEDKDEFLLGESAKLHEGAVTALLFEPDELRFLSAGADQKLLSTHARGKLEPEDKGRGNNHTDHVTALIWGPGDRLYSGSRDKTAKNWPRTGNVKPATVKDGVSVVVDLAIVQVHNRADLAVACADNGIRLFVLDEAGKVGDCTHKVHGVHAWARHELDQDDARRRETALKAVAGFNDAPALHFIGEQVGRDGDHGLRLLATQLLGDSGNPRAATPLEKWLGHADEAVRRAALAGLRKLLGEADLRPLALALKADKADVGREAVVALETLARKDDQALAQLTGALEAKTPEVRQAALASLEKVHDAQSPDASLVALGSKHGDVRRLALVRLFQRQLLHAPRVATALRRRCEDEDADVRHAAFLLSLYTRDKLVAALRSRDPELQRQLVELETFGQEAAPEEKKGKASRSRAKEAVVADIAGQVEAVVARKAKETPPNLDAADYEPLLQAAACRALDTSLHGARGLAVLGDPRAFGLLLQLSRAEDTAARAGVCRALAVLDDARSVERLRSLLYDEEAEVRDAAFTALTHLHAADPLLGAESGLNAAFEDVRRRGLQVLISAIRKAPPKKADAPAWQLLVRALNDSFDSVRGEAFKAALNIKIGGGGVQTLRFVLQSVHADVRREVLTEVMAQVAEQWAWNLLLEFYNDADADLRREAFDFAVKKTKELGPLEAGLGSQNADVRQRSVEALVKKHSKAAQALLARALNDPEKEVRLKAFDALVDDDAQPALLEALKSPHADVRVRAAIAVARHGNAAALAPLTALVSAELPAQKERRKEWAELVKSALEGLRDLNDSAALPHIIPHLNRKAASIRKEAARALIVSAIPNHLEALRQALQHSDPEVKYRAALGLAFAGDPLVASLVFAEEAAKVLVPEQRVLAAFGLGAAGEDRLIAFLDDDNEAIRTLALVLLLLRELKAHHGTPRRCLACLASRMPRVRLTAARALESFVFPAATAKKKDTVEEPSFLAFVTQLLNDRGEEQPWKIGSDTVDTLAELMTHGHPIVRLRAACVWLNLAGKEQTGFNWDWRIAQSRFAVEIKQLLDDARQRPATPVQVDAAQLRQLAFGAYVGLVREQNASLGAQVVRVRQTALARILALAQSDPQFARAAVPVFVQALGDPNAAVRGDAFAHLQALHMDAPTLGAEAIETGHDDMCARGLEALSAGAADAKGQAILERIMLTRMEYNLTTTAAKLLQAQRGTVAVASQALTAVDEVMRQKAVLWLAAEYDNSPEAVKQLRHALQSRYPKVREAAALELAVKKDAAAFDALVKMLAAAEAPRQKQAIEALTKLGDPRAPDAFLDRLENDPGGTAVADDLFKAVGRFRRPENVDRLLTMMDRPNWRNGAYHAVLAISGFDQPNEDSEDERTDRSWEDALRVLRDFSDKQYPRHGAIVARLLERCHGLGDVALLRSLVGLAYWARGAEVDAPFALLASHPDELIRRSVVGRIGWRMRKRTGSAEPLLKTLGHKDPVTQFLAAEGLALAGRGEGANVLLSAVELMTDLDHRKRAVRALGTLADLRALDLLLRLTGEDGHALQDEAAEAIGHLGKSAKAEAIFLLLERYAKGQGTLAQNAVKGLRWFNTVAGWQLIRQRAVDPAFPHRQTAVEMLGHHDDPATRDLLLKHLAEDDDLEVVKAANASAVRLLGKDNLEVDYAWLQNSLAEDHEDGSSLKAVGERGDPRRIFAILPRCPDNVQERLTTSLLNRPTLPVAEAQEAVAGNDERTVRLAAQVLGRAGTAAGKAAGAAVEAALAKWQRDWEERRAKMAQANETDYHLAQRTTPCVESLAWAAGRLGVASEALRNAAAAWPDDGQYQPIRRAAVLALASGKMTEPVLQVLEAVARDNDPETRTLAADALARHGGKRRLALAEQLLSDRTSFNRLTAREGAELASVLRTAASQVHYQPVALPQLIAQADVDGLSAVLENGKLPEAPRLGAIEALARLASPQAEAPLVRFAQAKKEDEELRKAAWRALRRSRRLRQKKAVAAR